MFVQALDRTGHDADGREVGEGHQEHRQDPQAARRQLGRHFLQLHHGHEFVGNQLGGHDAADLQGFVFRNAHDPGERIEEVTEDFLEAQAEDSAEYAIERGDQGDETNQHRGDELWPSCRLPRCSSSSLLVSYGLTSDSTIKVLNIFNTSAATTNLASSMVM